MRISLEIKMIFKATGLDHESFLDLFQLVDPGKDIKFFDSCKSLS